LLRKESKKPIFKNFDVQTLLGYLKWHKLEQFLSFPFPFVGMSTIKISEEKIAPTFMLVVFKKSCLVV
jgi:hypothetical protein